MHYICATRRSEGTNTEEAKRKGEETAEVAGQKVNEAAASARAKQEELQERGR